MACITRHKGKIKEWGVRWRVSITDANGDTKLVERSRWFEKRRSKDPLEETAEKFKAKLELADKQREVRAGDLETVAGIYIREKLATAAYRTAERYHGSLKGLVDIIGNPMLSTISSEMMVRYRNEMQERLQASTVRNNVKDVRIFFNWCVQQGFLRENPARPSEVPLPKVKRKIPKWLSPEEVDRLLSLAREESEEFYLVCLLGVRAGLRRAEIQNIRKCDLDFDQITGISDGAQMRGTIRILSKGSEERIVPMHPEVREALLAWPIGPVWVFGRLRERDSNDHRSTAQGKQINAWLKANGFSVTMHGLRHTFATQLLQLGATLEAVRQLLGHRDLQTTAIYLHALQSEKASAVGLLGSRLPDSDTRNRIAFPTSIAV